MATPLAILTDNDVRALLLSLTKADIERLQDSLAEALHTYSTGTQDETACSSNQPHRTSIKLKNGSTLLFMPAATCDGAGMKILTLADTSSNNHSSNGVGAGVQKHLARADTTSSSSSGGSGSGSGSKLSNNSSGSESIASFTSSSSSSSSLPTSISSKPSTTDSLSPTTTTTTTTNPAPHGTLTLLDRHGRPRALLSASTLTAFRTALASTMLLRRRETVHTITVFGAGQQAYWHIRLSLLLRGADIKRVNIINRSFARAQPLLQDFYSEAQHDWRSGTKFSVLSAEYGEYDRVLKEEVRKADAIFCCTAASTPLFPPEHLTAHEGRRKGRLVAAIGSYRPSMAELHPDVLRQAVGPGQLLQQQQHHHRHHHHHKHAASSGVVVVDSLSACLRDAGEVVQAGLGPEQLVEIGELVMLKRQAEAKKRAGGEASVVDRQTDGLKEWLVKGNVVYKSVGLGLMDVVVGGDLVTLAAEKGVGTWVDGF
ncbi:MAG: hypothetical protein M1816_006248 [Peltula sp. TS41687]|nr:MAG: hypothetical protein M1816_006248 [Peltula sp. TS41687]